MQYRKYTDIQDEIIKTIEVMVNSVLKKKMKTSALPTTLLLSILWQKL